MHHGCPARAESRPINTGEMPVIRDIQGHKFLYWLWFVASFFRLRASVRPTRAGRFNGCSDPEGMAFPSRTGAR